MEIRPASVEDASGIATVHVASWRWAYADLLPRDVLDGSLVEDRERMWADVVPRGGVLVAEEAARVIGFASVGTVANGDLPGLTGELFAIYIAPEAIGTGLGRALLSHAMETLRVNGSRRAILWVLASNARARRFYEVAGWALDGAASAYAIGGVDYPTVRYATNL